MRWGSIVLSCLPSCRDHSAQEALMLPTDCTACSSFIHRLILLGRGLPNIFFNGSNSKHFWLCEPCGLCVHCVLKAAAHGRSRSGGGTHSLPKLSSRTPYLSGFLSPSLTVPSQSVGLITPSAPNLKCQSPPRAQFWEPSLF